MKKVFLLRDDTRKRLESMLNQHENMTIVGGRRTLSRENSIFEIDAVEQVAVESTRTFLYARLDEGDDALISVDFGTVGNVVPSNINDKISISGKTLVWVKFVMKGRVVDSAEIEAGTELPESDEPYDEGEPDLDENGDPIETEFFFLLAHILRDGGRVIVQNTGNGSLGVLLYSAGRKCIPPEGDNPSRYVDEMNIAIYRRQS